MKGIALEASASDGFVVLARYLQRYLCRYLPPDDIEASNQVPIPLYRQAKIKRGDHLVPEIVRTRSSICQLSTPPVSIPLLPQQALTQGRSDLQAPRRWRAHAGTSIIGQRQSPKDSRDSFPGRSAPVVHPLTWLNRHEVKAFVRR